MSAFQMRGVSGRVLVGRQTAAELWSWQLEGSLEGFSVAGRRGATNDFLLEHGGSFRLCLDVGRTACWEWRNVSVSVEGDTIRVAAGGAADIYER